MSIDGDLDNPSLPAHHLFPLDVVLSERSLEANINALLCLAPSPIFDQTHLVSLRILPVPPRLLPVRRRLAGERSSGRELVEAAAPELEVAEGGGIGLPLELLLESESSGPRTDARGQGLLL